MVSLIAVEGSGNSVGYPSVPSFMDDLHSRWNQACRSYVFGQTAQGMQALVESAAPAQLALPGVQGLIIAAYGTGATYAIRAIRQLKAKNITIDCLAIFDGLALDASCYVVPSNVKMTFHARRIPVLSGSLLQYSACGTSSPNGFKEKFYLITHRGAGGVDRLANSRAPVNPQDKVWEDQIPHQFQLPTNITRIDDWDAAGRLQKWMYGNIFAEAGKIGAGQPQPAPNPPGPNPGNGAPSGVRTHIVQSGESLSIIADQFWGDVLLWPIIHKANLDKVPNQNLIKPGQALKIPDISGMSQAELNRTRQEGRNWR